MYPVKNFPPFFLLGETSKSTSCPVEKKLPPSKKVKTIEIFLENIPLTLPCIELSTNIKQKKEKQKTYKINHRRSIQPKMNSRTMFDQC